MSKSKYIIRFLNIILLIIFFCNTSMLAAYFDAVAVGSGAHRSIIPMSGLNIYVVTGNASGNYNSLEDAVNACNSAGSGTYTITLAADDPSQGSDAKINSGVKITLRSNPGDKFSITQQGNSRHIYVNDGASLTLENITLEGLGNLPGDSENGGVHVRNAGALALNAGSIIRKCFWHDGGGIFADTNSTVTLNGGIITNNKANSDGGGIRGTKASIIINSGEISDNEAPYGAGISANNASTLAMYGGTIAGNSKSKRGGGINLDGGTILTMSGGSIDDNKAETGGGILANRSVILLNDCNITNNKVYNITNGDGGGIHLESSQLTINSGVIIKGNTASNNGGGIHMVKWSVNSVLIMNDGLVRDNEARDGGGIYADEGTVTLNGGTVINNKADDDGGGIRVTKSTLSMDNIDVIDNEAQYGAGLSANAGSNVTMSDSNITGNICGNRGGGVNIDGNTTFDMNSGEISNNAAANGGAVIASLNSTFVMNDGKITNNVSSGNGGGFSLENSNLSINDGEVEYNTAENGGGVYLNTGSQITISNGEIRNNNATDSGGGIYTDDHDYNDPVSLTAYKNIKGAKSSNVVGNTSTATQRKPYNYTAFTDFDGILLNNDQINYYPSLISLTYEPNVSNNGSGSTVTENFNVGDSVEVKPASVIDSAMRVRAAIYEFKYWNTAADGVSGKRYEPGDIFTIMSNTTLYAIWGQASLPTSAPTVMPTVAPTNAPTGIPTNLPTAAPTNAPSGMPTGLPTAAPTNAPSSIPTIKPSNLPDGGAAKDDWFMIGNDNNNIVNDIINGIINDSVQEGTDEWEIVNDYESDNGSNMTVPLTRDESADVILAVAVGISVLLAALLFAKRRWDK